MRVGESGNPGLLLMAAGLTDHAWTIEALMMNVVVPEVINM